MQKKECEELKMEKSKSFKVAYPENPQTSIVQDELTLLKYFFCCTRCLLILESQPLTRYSTDNLLSNKAFIIISQWQKLLL